MEQLFLKFRLIQLGGGIDKPTGWLICILYMQQIYFDFAGYSDVAIGLSKIIGLDFKENFYFPYVSTSITEFWKRWHISLGLWFRKYIYIPMGGNRKGKKRTVLNSFIVMVIREFGTVQDLDICYGVLSMAFVWWEKNYLPIKHGIRKFHEL